MQRVGPHVAIYVPHGAIPDRRGFAPAIAAWEAARRMRVVAPYVISASEDYRLKLETVEGIDVYRLHESVVYRRLFRKITRIDPWPLHRRAARVARRAPTDVFHAHQLEFPVADFQRAVGFRLPVLVHAHVTNVRFDAQRGVAHRYLAVSNHVRACLMEKGYPADRIEVVSNGVDTARFAPVTHERLAEIRREFGLPERARVLAFAGRKQEVKGFHVFLRVAERLLNRRADVYAMVAGPEPGDARRDSSYSERQARRARLAATGRYLEFPALPHPRLADLMRASDVMLLPSLDEPQGMVMVEALATGAIVISSNIGGIRESIRNGESGFLLERPDDDEEVMRRVEDVLDRLDSLAPMRAAARADMVARYDWSVVTGALERIYLSSAVTKEIR
jgi:glycosyltransferase involved in cell wall biosynthesis